MLHLRFFLIVYFISTALLYAQINLVPNPSFEDTVICPDASAQIDRASHWFIAKETPDYFNACCIYPQFSVPDNLLDFQFASTGNAYCGFVAYSTVDPNYREIIGVQLSNPLTIGSKYYIQFKVSATKKHSNGACNKLGMLFSNNQYTLNNPLSISNFAQFWTDTIITDTVNWSIIKGSFVADSAYSYLYIGNFFENQFVDTSSFWYINALEAYYLVDDICVSTDSNTCNEPILVRFIKKLDFKIELYPNPVSDLLYITMPLFETKKLELFNCNGDIVFSKVFNKTDSNIQIDVSKLIGGFYSLHLTSDTFNYNSNIIIIHKI